MNTDYSVKLIIVGLLTCCLFLEAATATCSAADADADANAGGLEKARIRLVNGSSIRATIDSFDEKGQIQGSRILKGIQLGQITGIEIGKQPAIIDGGVSIHLSSGGFLKAKNVTISNDQITVIDHQNRTFEIPIEAAAGVIWKVSPTVQQNLAKRSAEDDCVVVATSKGEIAVKGFLESLDRTHVSINYRGKSRRIAREKVLAVVPAALDEQTPNGLKATITTTDGSQLTGVLRQFQDNEVQLAITKTFSLSVSAEQICKIAIQSDRLLYLSDVQPIRQEEQTQFVVARKWQSDRSLLGNPLRLRYSDSGRVIRFDKGIGTRSYTSLVFNNDKNYDQFRAVVGIDAETAGNGNCEMVVEGDGIRLWSKQVTGKDDPEPIVIDISGIAEVSLIVLPGENFDLADHANWADARFTRSN